MGWTVLYIAFGVVALWLLGEVLLQYKARLRWRLLAFVGFIGVVLGVLMPSIYVIGAGAITFAIGQTFVTLSFRRGFSTGWALGGSPGESRRRKTEPRAVQQEPTLEVSDLEYTDAYQYTGTPPDGTPAYGTPPEGTPDYATADYGTPQYVTPDYGTADYGTPDYGTPPQGTPAHGTPAPLYAAEPLPDDTGQYGVYSDSVFPPPPAAAPAAATAGYGYDELSGYDQQSYGYEPTGQQQYAAYSDPYIGTQAYGGAPLVDGGYDTYGGQQGYQDPYAPAYPGETPPGGVWVPQQRSGDEAAFGGELPPEQPYPYQNGYDTGYNQQQPYSY
ncbi:hypothetical protein DSC45_10180 [Streptomyces sp. YIM 130001]|uniref:SCO2102 family sporulation regulator n=1 Tax=Streptomyces sp. YIM 130001 TaxID=2259644 RepID=UPI000E655225|nr:hypothetical protein [Streptomyces sp. YIM 130001]RII18273.1 hypothetical protein DSC45_10180 [Streptomyces sp. YIM 130001]